MKDNKINKLIYAGWNLYELDGRQQKISILMALKPTNLYGLTKVFNEDMAKFYSQ